jgi:hypothetical protein
MKDEGGGVKAEGGGVSLAQRRQGAKMRRMASGGRVGQQVFVFPKLDDGRETEFRTKRFPNGSLEPGRNGSLGTRKDEYRVERNGIKWTLEGVGREISGKNDFFHLFAPPRGKELVRLVASGQWSGVWGTAVGGKGRGIGDSALQRSWVGVLGSRFRYVFLCTLV